MIFMWVSFILYIMFLKPEGVCYYHNKHSFQLHTIRWNYSTLLFKTSDWWPSYPKIKALHHWSTWWSCHESVSGKLDHCPNMTAFSWHISRQTAGVLWEQAVGWPLTLPSLPMGQKSHSDAQYFCKTPKKALSQRKWLVILLKCLFTLSYCWEKHVFVVAIERGGVEGHPNSRKYEIVLEGCK